MEIEFLNLDLEIESLQSLQPIIDELGESVLVLHNAKNESGLNFVSLELNQSNEKSVDETISLFCSFIENLSDEAKQVWNNSHSKKFDAGFQSGDFPKSYQTEISNDTIGRVSKFGACIVFTLYSKK